MGDGAGSEAARGTRVRLCGTPGLEIDGRDVAARLPGGQAGLVLWYLLAAPDRAADREELIEMLWAGRAPKDPQAALRPLLSRLRRALAPASLEGRERVRLALPEPVWVDVEAAERGVRGAREAARARDWAAARSRAEAALALMRPGLLPDRQADWLDDRRRELEEVELEALELLARSGLGLGGGELAGAERAGRELVARAPFRETGYRFLMEALAAAGNTAEALRVYERLRVLLRDELGAAPAPDVQALHQRLLTGEAPGPAASPGSAPPKVPLPSVLSPRERSGFVGREQELTVLREAWRHAREGSRRLVLLAGEPGVGKTRLMSELATEAHEEGTVLYAGCPEEALVSYQPFVEALRHYARTSGLDPAGLSLGPGAAELARLIPELAAAPLPRPLDAPGDPEARRYLMFEAVSSLLAEASSRAPVLLVLDDLHWADRATLHLLRHLLRAPDQASLLIVGGYRDAEVPPTHPLSGLLADLRRDGRFDWLPLGGLDERGVAALIAAHAGHDAPAALVESVHGQTEGNPFFVEEVMRHLIETGVVFERGGRWTSALTPGEIGVPQGVKDVLSARLAGLSDGCRSALLHAAVLGREFTFDVLSRMAEAGDEALIAAVEEAVEAQLVVETRGDAGPAYAFTHALVRETLYGGLSAPRRERLHARAASALEQAARPVAMAGLALHHRLAGSAGDATKAIECSLEAGHEARELFAWDEAADHWDGALAVMGRAGGRHAERAALLVALADLMAVTGDLSRQIACLEQALAVYEELSDEERAAQVHSRLGQAHSLIDSIDAEHLDIHRAFRHFAAARDVLDRGPARRARGHLETGVSTALTYGFRIPEGIEAARRGMDVGERIGDEVLWAGAAAALAWHTLASGDLDEGLQVAERAFEIADRNRLPLLAWMACNMQGQFTWAAGDPDGARTSFERPLTLPYLPRSAYRGEIADGLGRCHAAKGELSEARRLLPEARAAWISHALRPVLDLWDGGWDQVESLAAGVLETSRRTGNRWDEWASRHLAARVRHLRGEAEPAGDLLEQALAIVVDGGAGHFEMWLRLDLVRVRAAQGRLEEAERQVQRCRELRDGGGWRGRAGQVALGEAVVRAATDRIDEAAARFADARSTFERFGLRMDEADALHQWGRVLAGAGDARGAAERLEEALDVYRTCGAGQPWTQRVESDRRRLDAATGLGVR